ncbi:MAG: hypothetical protein H0T40_09255 [Geodermatophilaceae bacterium]|nr:hypothetical protein [Geodermatophilaceae bacterium]
MAGVALRRALELIAQGGGGSWRHTRKTSCKKISASFLYNDTRSLFEQAGFIYDRGKGKSHCVMSETVGHG